MTYEALVLQKTPIITFGYIMQVAVSLAVVIAIIYLAAKYLLPRMRVAPQGKHIQVTDRFGIEPQVTIYTLKIAGQIYVVAVSNKNVTLIDKFKEGELG
jgi:flagellar biogenesis protein FliO